MKVGTISLQTAIVNTAEGKKASAELQNMQKQSEDIPAEPAVEPADAGATNRGAAYDTKLKDGHVRAQRKQRYWQDDLNVAQQDVVNNLGRDED